MNYFFDNLLNLINNLQKEIKRDTQMLLTNDKFDEKKDLYSTNILSKNYLMNKPLIIKSIHRDDYDNTSVIKLVELYDVYRNYTMQWIKKLSTDSQKFFFQLTNVFDQINRKLISKKESKFYNINKEINEAKDEFKGTSITQFVKILKTHMEKIMGAENKFYTKMEGNYQPVLHGALLNSLRTPSLYKELVGASHRHERAFGTIVRDKEGKIMRDEGNRPIFISFIDKEKLNEQQYDALKFGKKTLIVNTFKHRLRGGEQADQSSWWREWKEKPINKVNDQWYTTVLKNSLETIFQNRPKKKSTLIKALKMEGLRKFQYTLDKQPKNIKEEILDKLFYSLQSELFASIHMLKSAKKFKYLQLHKCGSDAPIEFWLPPQIAQGAKNRLMKRAFVFHSSMSSLFPLAASSTDKYARKTFTSATKNMRVNIIPLELVKQFPQNAIKKPPFSPIHVNSAVTGAGIGGSRGIITVYRKEELFKTLLHEMVHRFSVDDLSKVATKWILTQFSIEPISNEILFYEAVTETLGCLTSSIMNAYECCGANGFDKVIPKVWEAEKRFSLYQAAKVLYISGFKNFAEFMDPKNTKHRVKQNNTSVAEYYIFKAAFLQKIDQFLSIFKIADEKKRNTTWKFFLLKCCKDKQFQEKVDILINAFITKVISTTSSLFRTGRMTVIEMPWK